MLIETLSKKKIDEERKRSTENGLHSFLNEVMQAVFVFLCRIDFTQHICFT